MNNSTNNHELVEVEYLSKVGSQSEYHEKTLSAWVICFVQQDNPAIYVRANSGTLEAIRYDTWRNLDFLWMLQTMDYDGRDNFGNLVLRSFSILGLITGFSGFMLFYVSSPTVRKWKKKVGR